MRPIDADALIKELQKKDSDAYFGDMWYCTTVYDEIDNAPTVEPKKGKWMPHDIPWYECSECGAIRKNASFMENFCPNCGAKMIEPQAESEE